MASKPEKAMTTMLKKDAHWVPGSNMKEVAKELAARMSGNLDDWEAQVRPAIEKGLLIPQYNTAKRMQGYRTLNASERERSSDSVKSPAPKYRNASPKVSVA